MLRFKPLIILVFLLTTTFGFSQFTDVINSNRPGESQAAFSVGKTVIQAEFGAMGYRDDHYTADYEAKGFDYELALRYGAFFEQLEFIGSIKYQYEDYSELFMAEKRSGIKSAIIGAKFLVYDPNKNYQEKPNLYSWTANHKFKWRAFIPAVGVYAGINLNLAGDKFYRRIPGYAIIPEKNTSLKGMILTQNQFGRYALVTNIIVDRFPAKTEIDYVITLTRGFSARWSGFIETQGFTGDEYADQLFRGGAAFLVQQNIQVDASIGTNIKNTPTRQQAGIGVSWRFDANYNDVFLRIPKEKKSKEDKKKDKKKEKAKKRLDEIEGGGDGK